MPYNKDFTRRIEILDECLRRRQKKWFIEDLLEALNEKLDDRFDKKVSKRTLYSDLSENGYTQSIYRRHNGWG
jgi:hypothetical protein